MPLTAISIDQREPKWVQDLKFGGVSKSVGLLDFGDFWLACEDGTLVIVERKTPNDFLNTLKDDRLFQQMGGLIESKKNLSAWPYILITGEFRLGQGGKVFTDRETGWDWKSVHGALLSIQEMGVFVTHCAGDTDVEAALIRLSNRSHKPDMIISETRTAKFMGISASFLCGLPDIGPERVGTILDACGGSVAWALVALTDDSIQLPGVGPGIRNNIRHILGLGESQRIDISLENGKEVLTITDK